VDRAVRRTGECSAVARGGGNPLCFGKWGQVIPIQGGKWYRVRVVFRHENIEDVNLHVLIALVWKVGEKPNVSCPTDHIEHFTESPDGWTVGEQVFRAPDQASALDLELYLRLTANGTVWWDEVEVRETAPVPPRLVRLATMKWRPAYPSTLERNLAELGRLLDEAAAQQADLICLPEMVNAISIPGSYEQWAEPIPGPAYAYLSAKAKAHSMYVLGCIYEREGDFIFNTAFLLDRQGGLVGKYRKVHLYWPEEREGVSPGDEFPVFQTDFGKVGVIICYDSWFAESVRVLALKGAEVVLCPNAGYEPRQVYGRAGDNAVYLVIATLNSDGAIISPRDEVLAEARFLNTVKVATVDLNDRITAHPNAGGTLNASPGGRRAMRHAPSLKLYQEISDEIRWHLTGG